jgi:peptide/nickel transport system substrate-binding protein
MNKKLFFVLGILVMISIAVAACTTPAAEPETITVVETVVVEKEGETVVETVVVEKEVSVVETVEVEVEPEKAASTRKGGWLDEIVFSLVSADSAITQLEAGAIDLYGSGLASSDFPAIQEAGLKHSTEIGGMYYELTYNPSGPVFEGTGKLNPFSVAKVREAMNMLVDRDYINQEIYAGGGLPKFFSIVTNYPDYANFVDTVRSLEAKYAYNPEKADEIITAEMEALGAEKVDGKWTYNGEDVVIIMLIRTDSDGTRVPVGDYVANQLESIGFTVDRQYKTSSEASPIWVLGNVADGLFHIYTGAWGATVIDRDMGDNFQFFSSPASGYGFSTLWQAYNCGDEFETLANDLNYNNFTTLDERDAAFRRALVLDSECALRTWLIDGGNFAPYNQDVDVTYDIAAGIGSSALWPLTVRFTDYEGGRLRFGQPDMFVDPWNPVAGSNWAYDGSLQRATSSFGVVSDPHTGLAWPQRIESATVVVQEGLPVGKTLDWVTLEFAPEIVVPDDAWVDWDADNQVFITAAEAFTETQTAQTKSVVTYPADLYDTVKWHDGSPFSVADVVMYMIMNFDPAKETSAIFDESQVSNLEGFLSVFKGIKIVSTDPLVIEYYQDGFDLDAENMVTTWYPAYGYGEGAWHTIAVSNLAEASNELAYSADKADTLEVEWMSWIGGPSLDILKKYLDQAAAETLIPYAATLGQYITAEEAAARYANLAAWYDAHNNFWVGTGPYYLDQVFLTENVASMLYNPDFPDMADRWSGFSTPKIAEVEMDGPGQVVIGEEATFDVYVTFEGEAYPGDEIKEVKYILYDATGALVEVGEATMVADGQYSVVLSAEATGALEAGANKLEVAVAPYPVAIPTFQSIEFVTAP